MRVLIASLLVAGLGCSADSTTSDPNGIHPADAGAGQPDAAEADAPPPMKSCNATMTLGSGVREFQEVHDGDTLYLYKGPQGGYMIYLSVRAKGLDPSDVNFCYVEKFADTGGVFGRMCWRVQLTNNLGDGTYERVGIWGQVDTSYWTSPQTIRGKNVTIDATATDANGCEAEDAFSVYVSTDPGR